LAHCDPWWRSNLCQNSAHQTPAAASQPAAPRDPPRARATTCACGCQMKRIGEDVAEKLDYTPACSRWSATSVASGPARSAKPSPGAGGRARHRQGHPHHGAAGPGAGGQVRRPPAAVPPGRHLRRAGLAIPRSTLAQWVGTCGVQLQPLVDALKDEMLSTACCTPTRRRWQMLKPGNGKTHRAYLWAYAPARLKT
jgi:transposase